MIITNNIFYLFIFPSLCYTSLDQSDGTTHTIKSPGKVFCYSPPTQYLLAETRSTISPSYT